MYSVCPICMRSYSAHIIESHVNECLDSSATTRSATRTRRHFDIDDIDLPPTYSEEEIIVEAPQECPICRVSFPASLIQEHAEQCGSLSEGSRPTRTVARRTSSRREEPQLPTRSSREEGMSSSPLMITTQIRLEVLKEQAKIDILLRKEYSVNVWLITANSIFAKAKDAYTRRDAETSFVGLQKFVNIVSKLHKHPDYADFTDLQELHEAKKKASEAKKLLTELTVVILTGNWPERHRGAHKSAKLKKKKSLPLEIDDLSEVDQEEVVVSVPIDTESQWDHPRSQGHSQPTAVYSEESLDHLPVITRTGKLAASKAASPAARVERTYGENTAVSLAAQRQVAPSVEVERFESIDEFDFLAEDRPDVVLFRVRALYDYASFRSDELSFKEGDIMEVLETEDEWYKARRGDATGFIPLTYVDPVYGGDEEGEDFFGDQSGATHSQQSRPPVKEYSKEWQQLISQHQPGLFESLQERERKRQYIILELIDSWQKYVADLEAIRTGFMAQLRSDLPVREFQDIFCNFEEVLDTSAKLGAALELCQQSQNYYVKVIGAVFSREFPKLKTYAAYCGNLRRAIGLLAKRADSDSRFQQLAKETGLGIQEAIAFSFKPMQRIVKLELMVKGIRDHTEDGPEQWELQTSLALIEDICMHLNHVKCAMDDFTKQREAKINPNFDVNFMSPSQRTLISAGALVSTEDSDKLNLMALLFEDCLVLMNEDESRKKREKRTSFISRVTVLQKSRGKTKTRFTLFHPPLFLSFARISDSGKNRFVIVDTLHSVEFEMEAPSSTAKVDWIRALQAAVAACDKWGVVKSVQYPHISPDAKILCAFTRDDETMVFGTDKGIATASAHAPGSWRIIKTDGKKKIVAMKLAEQHRAIIALTKEESNLRTSSSLRIFSLLALEDSSVRSKKIDGTSGTRAFDISVENPDHIHLVYATDEYIHDCSLHNNGFLQEKRRIPLEKPCKVVSLIGEEIACGYDTVFAKLSAQATSVTPLALFKHIPSPLPSPVVAFFSFLNGLFLCFQDYGLLTDSQGQSYHEQLTFKWTSPAISFGVLDVYFLVFTQKYIEVRDLQRPWKIIQLLAASQQTLVDADNKFFFAPASDKSGNVVSTLELI